MESGKEMARPSMPEAHELKAISLDPPPANAGKDFFS
jgi:hypothetical protein